MDTVEECFIVFAGRLRKSTCKDNDLNFKKTTQ